jgi:ribosome-binding protein aMBF1 (putative translation factor)
MTITAAQCRAARALTDVSREALSDATGIDENTIRSFEKRLAEPDADIATKLRQGLETLGAVFLADDEHGGMGVRLKFTRSESRRIATLENEGGPVGEDDVAD